MTAPAKLFIMIAGDKWPGVVGPFENETARTRSVDVLAAFITTVDFYLVDVIGPQLNIKKWKP